MKPVLILGGLFGLYLLYKSYNSTPAAAGVAAAPDITELLPSTPVATPGVVGTTLATSRDPLDRFANTGQRGSSGPALLPTGNPGHGLFYQTPQYLLAETSDMYGNKILLPCPSCGPSGPGYSGADLMTQLSAANRGYQDPNFTGQPMRK